jgi:hypothetical protein
MMDSTNPFAPPLADLAVPTSGEAAAFSLNQQVLRVRKGAALPNVCLWSGEPEGAQRVRKVLHWAPPWTAILALWPLIYLVVYFIVRKSGSIDYSLGPGARARKQQALVYGGGGMLLSFAALALGIARDAPLSALLGVLGFLAALIFTLIRARVVQVVRIDKEHVHLKLRPAAAQAFARLATSR